MSICSYKGCGNPVIYACDCDSNELYFCSNHLKDHIKKYPAINHRYEQAFKDTQLEMKKHMKIIFHSALKELDKMKQDALLNASKKISDINKWVYEYLGNINYIENDLQDSLRQFFGNKTISENDFEQVQIKVISYLNQTKSWASLDDIINPWNKIISKQNIEINELKLSLALEKSKISKLESNLNETINIYQAALSEKEIIIQEIIESSDNSSRATKKYFKENENKINQLEKALKTIESKKKWKKHKIEELMQANLFLSRFQEDSQNSNFIQKWFLKQEKYNPFTSCFFDNCEWPGGDLIEHIKIYHQCKESEIFKDGTMKYWNAKVWKNCGWDISVWKLDSGIPIIVKSFCDEKAFYVQFYDLEAKRIKLKLTFANSEAKMQFWLKTESLAYWKEKYREMPFCMNLRTLEKYMLVLSEELEGYKRLCILIQIKNA